MKKSAWEKNRWRKMSFGKGNQKLMSIFKASKGENKVKRKRFRTMAEGLRNEAKPV